jgi:tetratricopeptide (TPR) repeat protein
MHAEARVSNNLAIIAEEMGDYIEARRLARRAKDIFLETGDRRNQAYASGTLANLMVGAGRYREAIDLYRSADRIFVKLGETHPHYYTVGNLGDLDLLLGDFDAAQAKYAEVLNFARERGDEELEAETAVRCAEHLYYSKRSAEARSLYNEAISKAEKVGSMEYRIRGTIGLCRYYIGERDVLQAGAAIDHLKTFAQESKSDRTRYEAAFLSGELARINGDLISAIPFYKDCATYAKHQQQFELSLKCLVRLVELQPDDCADAVDGLNKLLRDFERANGGRAFGLLMSSRYFKFFHKTLKKVYDATVAG